VELLPGCIKQVSSRIKGIEKGLAGIRNTKVDEMNSRAISKYEIAKYERTPESTWAKVILISL
jgi:hypothetical protein